MVSNIVKIQLIDGPVEGFLDVKNNESFPLNFAISDIRDISSRTGSFSKTIKLAGTKNNNLLLNNYFDVNVKAGTFNVNKIQKVAIIQNGIVIKDNYFLRLLKVVKIQNRGEEIDDYIEYEVQVRDSLGDFFKDIDNKEIVDLDGWGLYNHLYTKEAVVDSFDHTWEDGYKYVLPWIGSPDPTNYGLSELMPGVYAKQIFDRIHQQAGYQYEWDDFSGDTVQFDKLILPYNGDQKKLSEEFKQSVKVIANESTTQENESNFIAGVVSSIPRKKVDVTNEIVDPSNLYNPTTSTYENIWEVESPNAVLYNINIEWQLYFKYVNTTGFNVAYIRNFGSPGSPLILRYFPLLEVYNQFNTFKGSSALNFDFTNQFQSTSGLADWNNNGNSIELPTGEELYIYPGEYVAGGGNNQITINVTQLNIGYLLELFQRVNLQTLNAQWCGAVAPGVVTNTPVIVNYGLRIKNISIEIVPSTDSGLLPNSPINLKQFLPNKVKQSEFLKSIYQKYNLYAEIDLQNPNKIIYKSRDKYYDDGEIKDWTQKQVKEIKQELYFVPEISSKKVILSYKDDDNDAGLTAYRGEVGETYAQVEVEFENENVRGVERKEEIFSPTINLPTEFGAILPILAPDHKMNMRILIDGGKYPCAPYTISQSSNNVVTLNEYPYFGLLDKPTNPSFSIEYAQPDYYPYNPGILTQNNLYVNYWRRTLAQINSGKLLKIYFWLTEEDIFKLRLSDKIKVNNALWYINKVVDYDANAHKPTLVELLSVEDDLKLPRFGRIIKPVQPGVTAPVLPAPVLPTGPVRPIVGAVADIVKKRTVATSVFNGYIDADANQGVRNVLPKDFSGVVVGNDKSITENGFYVDGTSLKSGELNIGENVIITEGEMTMPNNFLLNGVNITEVLTGSTSDIYTTGATLVGNVIEFDRNDMLNAFSVDLSSLTSGVPTSRNLTINGTTNQVTISPTGAQDLSTDRIWTLSLPQNIHTSATPTFAGATINGLTGIRASALGTTPTQILVVSADPSSTTRTIQTRTPAQILTDIGAQASLVNVATITSTTVLTATNEIVLCNQSTAINVTLPTPTNGKQIVIKDISGNAKINNITIVGTIDGVSNYVIDIDRMTIKLVANGTAWFII
jgi:hypothetical protein